MILCERITRAYCFQTLSSSKYSIVAMSVFLLFALPFLNEKFNPNRPKTNSKIQKLYDLKKDPLEMQNEYSNPEYKDIIINYAKLYVKLKLLYYLMNFEWTWKYVGRGLYIIETSH